jgi:mycoredoxin
MFLVYYTFCSKDLTPVLKDYCLKGSAFSMIHSDPARAAAVTDSTSDSMTNPATITMYSTTWCGDCRRARRVFADFGVSYLEVNIEDNENAAELVQTLNNGLRSVPTIVFPDGGILVEPSNAALAAVLARYATGTN